jgi:hypothetical protein
MIQPMMKYQKLIQSIPVNEHGFVTKRKTWEQFETKDSWFEDINNQIFKDCEEVCITRGELIELGKSDKIKEFIVKTIYWGYPKGFTDGRNIHLRSFLEDYPKLEKLVIKLKKEQTIENFIQFYKENVEEIKGMALSTFTKILQFLRTKVHGKEALILDNQIIDRLTVSFFKNEKFNKLTYNNAPKHYVLYLEYIDDLAKKIETYPQNIEMFLFIFGRIITPMDLPDTLSTEVNN